MPIRVCPGGGGFPGLLVVAGLLVCCPSPAAETLPEAAALTRRMIERAEAVAATEQGPEYTYEKRSLLEHLDAAGRPAASEEKIYEVTLIAGFPFNRLVKIQGHALGEKELQKEAAREERVRRKFISADAGQMAARKQAWVTSDLLDRYEFVVKERVILRNRRTLVLTFKPKDGDLPSTAFQDKLLNRMAGTLWVDEAEADITRVAASLVEPVSFGWFGVLASLSRCDLSLERQRMPDGVWVNTKQGMFLQSRKLAATTRVRKTEECCGFHKTEARR